jgi:hypothetical protein
LTGNSLSGLCLIEKSRMLFDFIRYPPRAGLEGTVREIADIVKRYNLQPREVHGDKYASKWTVERFASEGVIYQQNDADKSVYYLELEPLFSTDRIQILDNPELVRELRLLEKRPRATGKTLVDHPLRGHNDLANALAVSAFFAKKATVVQGYPIGVGRGLGAQIRRDIGSWRDSPFTNDGRLSQGIPVRRGL